MAAGGADFVLTPEVLLRRYLFIGVSFSPFRAIRRELSFLQTVYRTLAVPPFNGRSSSGLSLAGEE